MITIESPVRGKMSDDALGSFPNECCGFVFGLETEDGDRIITDLLIVNNAKEGDKTRRFEISPGDYFDAEQFATDKNLLLIGVYHSHPNHPAIPSEHDRKSAQPWFSYIILSVTENHIAGIRSWRLNEEEQFEEEIIVNYQIS
ncbi:MAG: Mov34/MPN/PAD-1 family protein [Chitinophagales bacterium]